jgi:tRNA-splicing ligase RtcB
MIFEIKDNRIPIKSWCEKIEDGAMLQARNLANHPTTFRHVALMPDCHSGYGMPIGGVIACDRAVIPNAVGVDIGCGMCAVQTDYPAEELAVRSIRGILDILKRLIPVGFSHHKYDQKWTGFDKAPDLPIIRREIGSARRQIGTLGGGNHFIEIQKGSDGNVWLMLHSGSRNFGYKIAREYNAQAGVLCKKRGDISSLYKGGDGLAFLPDDSGTYEEYLSAMDFALAFARENRRQMMMKFKDCAHDVLHCGFTQEINIHHNFAAIEEHFSRMVMVHRKGATQARQGQFGIIPGSMGTPSYIVRGLGNRESFESCSHGAGRIMGRKAFNRTHSVEECSRAMGDIVFDRWIKKKKKGGIDISEAPQAYKDIHEVIKAQQDLVEVVVKLEPLGVMKG